MTSRRFPGKVLAPLCGSPVIAHVVNQMRKVVGVDKVILVTSQETSDDPLAVYAEKCLGVPVFRGELSNVVKRFQSCLEAFPCEWFIRVCGDSPVIDPELITLMLGQIDESFDLITNVEKRTFPPGQSVEIVRSATFMGLDASSLDKNEQEHVTLHLYRQTGRYRICNISSSDVSLAQRRLVIDSLGDMETLTEMMVHTPGLVTGFARYAQVNRSDA